MQSKKINHNAGFSLVELIVVIALMGLLIGGTLITYYTISSHNIDKAKGYIEDALTEGRYRAMTTQAKSWDVILTTDNVKVYKTDSQSAVITDVQGNKFPKTVSIALQQSDSPAVYKLSDTEYDSIDISFKLLSGEVSKVSVVKDGTATELFTGSEAQYCDIILTYRNREKKVRLFYATGKFVADE